MNIGYKVISLGVGALAGLAARQVIGVIWEKGFGEEKPNGDDEHDLELPLARVVAFTAVTATVTSLFNEVAKRKVARWYGLGDRVGKGALDIANSK